MRSIPEKANLVLQLILIVLGLIIVRVWHLSVMQGDRIREEARRPQHKTILEPATRGTIRDRYNIPLAINKIHYQAAILYSQITDVPSIAWEEDASGRKVKKYKRREHIRELSRILAEELGLDAERTQDLIHSKAALYHQRPFVVKDNITEKQFYRLKMMEKDFPGLQAVCTSRRHYPLGRIGADIVGYMGAIDRRDYEAIIGEMRSLEAFLREWDLGNDPPLPEGMEGSAQVRHRLKDLQERAYSINDYVGKGGLEGRYEHDLRGYQGQKSFYTDPQGNLLRELPGSRATLPGQRLILSLSAELQEYAEKLLAENEPIRDGRSAHVDRTTGERTPLKQPWIKGGAIVVMDPHNGDVLAMASYPRYDPNDFITVGDPEIARKKQNGVRRWFEQESYLAEIWDQKRPLEKELCIDDIMRDEGAILTWDAYLRTILSWDSDVCRTLDTTNNLHEAIELQRRVDACLKVAGLPGDPGNLPALINYLYSDKPHERYGKMMPLKLTDTQRMTLRWQLDPYFEPITQNYNKVLLTDLCRIAAHADRFSQPLLEAVGGRSISTYRKESAAFVVIEETVKGMAHDLYHDIHFRKWRDQHERAFLKQKRAEEKAQKKYARPYLDYLDKEEAEQFATFWQKNRWILIQAFLKLPSTIDTNDEIIPYLDHFSLWATELENGAHSALPWHSQYMTIQEALHGLDDGLGLAYLQTIRGYHDLTRPLYGRYPKLRNENGQQLEKHLATAFYPTYGYGNARSFAFRQATTQGSIFKIVTAYEGLRQQYEESLANGDEPRSPLNPLDIVDKTQKAGSGWTVGTFSDGRVIPRLYKGGLLPRSLRNNVGPLNVVKALETSSNPYFALLAGDYLNDPEDLVDAARKLSYGARTGIDLPGELAGKLPDDVSYNRTGLYSMAIGQHKLIATPLQTAVMLSTIANGGKVVKPHVVKLTAGNAPIRTTNTIVAHESFPYQDALALVGINFPLFTATQARKDTSLVHTVSTEVVREVFLPNAVREPILQGMARSAATTQVAGGGSLSWVYKDHPKAIQDLLALKEQLIGKSSTSEVVETVDLDIENGANMYNHIWFGGISFNPDTQPTTFVSRNTWGEPELVVVVYLRYGGYGKEAAPVAAQVVTKWREIKQAHGDG